MITLRFISIRPGLIAPPGLSVSALQIPQETLTSMFQAKLKEKSPALPSTWLVGQILTKSYRREQRANMHSACVPMQNYISPRGPASVTARSFTSIRKE